MDRRHLLQFLPVLLVGKLCVIRYVVLRYHRTVQYSTGMVGTVLFSSGDDHCV